MDYANDQQHITTNAPPVLELQQQYHFKAQLVSLVRNESRHMLPDGNDAPDDYWGNGWSDDDDDNKLEADQEMKSTILWTYQEHTNDDDDNGNYYAKWSEHLDTAAPRRATIAQQNDDDDDDDADLIALQELIRLLQQTLPSASASVAVLNPLPKAIQHRYEWDENKPVTSMNISQ